MPFSDRNYEAFFFYINEGEEMYDSSDSVPIAQLLNNMGNVESELFCFVCTFSDWNDVAHYMFFLYR